MSRASLSLISHIMRSGNILPLTSRCNLNCVFCSHKQNPPGLKTYLLPERDPSVIIESFTNLSHDKKIIIGESATGIVEGEPFCYGGIKEILQELRRRFPQTEFQITTNGTLLEPNLLAFLKMLEPLELVVSFNTLDKRKEVLGDSSGRNACRILEEIKEAGLIYHGSVVAIPHVLGWDNLSRTLLALDERGAKTIRVFLPGFTRFAPSSLVFHLSLWKKLQRFVMEIRRHISTPVILDPPLLSDLEARVEGVLKNSPADRSGVKTGDVILQVEDTRVTCRVEAFNLTRKQKNPVLALKRNGREISVTLDKEKEQTPGFVMYSDVDPCQMNELTGRLQGVKGQDVLILTSLLGFPLINKMLEEYLAEQNRTKVMGVPSVFFGGSIMSAGLLVVKDFIRLIKNIEMKPQVIILPQKPFDREGKDLMGESCLSIPEKTGIPVIII